MLTFYYHVQVSFLKIFLNVSGAISETSLLKNTSIANFSYEFTPTESAAGGTFRSSHPEVFQRWILMNPIVNPLLEN